MNIEASGETVANVLACAAGGAFAVWLSPAATRRESMLRVVAVAFFGYFAGPGIVDLIDSAPSGNRRRLLFFGVGFASWVSLSVLMFWLESTGEKAKKNGIFWFLNMIRGNPAASTTPIPPTPDGKDKQP